MTTRTIPIAAALAASAALVATLLGTTSPTQAAPSIQNAPASQLDTLAGGTLYRARPFGRLAADTWEYYTVRLPRSGNYRISMTGFINTGTTPVSVQCAVVDKQKILADNLSGYYLGYFASSDAGVFDYGINETIDVPLKKSRALLLACFATEAIKVLKPITVTFQRTGPTKTLRTRPFTPPPAPQGSRGLVGLG